MTKGSKIGAKISNFSSVRWSDWKTYVCATQSNYDVTLNLNWKNSLKKLVTKSLIWQIVTSRGETKFNPQYLQIRTLIDILCIIVLLDVVDSHVVLTIESPTQLFSYNVTKHVVLSTIPWFVHWFSFSSFFFFFSNLDVAVDAWRLMQHTLCKVKDRVSRRWLT